MGGQELLLLGRRGKSDRRRRGAGGGDVEYTYPDDPTIPVTPTDPDPVEQDEDEAAPITGTLDPITAPAPKKKGGNRNAVYVSFSTSGGEVTITATASSFTPYLTVIDAATGATIAEGLSPLTVTLPVGSYIVELTSVEEPTTSATYALTLSAAVPALGYDQRWSGFSANAGAATFSEVGGNAGTAGTLASADDDAGPWVSVATTAVAANGAQVNFSQAGTGGVRRAWGPEMVAVVRVPGGVTAVKLTLGYVSGQPVTTGSGTYASQGQAAAAFRHFPEADGGGATWRAVTADGSSETVTDTGVAVDDTGRAFRVDCRDSGEVRFYVDGALVATHTTTLPPAATGIGPYLRVSTTEAVSKSIAVNRLWQRNT